MSGGAVGFAVLLCLLWGGLAPALKISLRYLPPLAAAGWRFLIAVICLVTWCRAMQIRWGVPAARQLPLVAYSLLFVLQIVLLNLGAQWTSSDHTVVLLNTNPFFVALLAHALIPGDRLNVKKSAGLLLAFSGVCVTFLDVETLAKARAGDLLVLLSASILGLLQIGTKYLVRQFSPFQIVIWEMIYGVPLFFLASMAFETISGHVWNQQTISSLLYQGVAVGAFCFAGWSHLLQRFSASKVSAFQFTTPLFGVIVSALILGDKASPSLLVGVALVAAGIYWISSREIEDRQEKPTTRS